MSAPLPSVPSSWKAVGTTSNTRYFITDADLLIVCPHPGTKDDGATARENAEFQMAYAVKLGRPIVIIVLLGNLTSQDADARRAYAELMDPARCFGAALVVENALSRAIAAFFMGLTRPRIPTQTAPNVDTAMKALSALRPGAKP